MISSIVVLASLAMTATFGFLYFRSARFREEIERPKYQFMEQLAQYESKKESVDGR